MKDEHDNLRKKNCWDTTSKTMTLICVTLVLAIFMFIAAPILVGWASGYLDPGDCDGQSGYGVSKLDSIVEEVVRQIFAQFREVSRKKLLESVKTNDAARIQKKIKKDLEAKQKELDDLKAETILVIRGISALDKELLGTLVAEAREALETLEKQLVQAQEEYEEATKTAKRSNYIERIGGFSSSMMPSARTPPKCRPGIWSFSKPQTQKPSTRRSKSIRHLCSTRTNAPRCWHDCMNWCRPQRNFPAKSGASRRNAAYDHEKADEADCAVSLTFEYSCEDAVVQKFVDKIMGYSLSRKAEFISIYCPVVQSKTYMIATVFWNKTA